MEISHQGPLPEKNSQFDVNDISWDCAVKGLRLWRLTQEARLPALLGALVIRKDTDMDNPPRKQNEVLKTKQSVKSHPISSKVIPIRKGFIKIF